MCSVRTYACADRTCRYLSRTLRHVWTHPDSERGVEERGEVFADGISTWLPCLRLHGCRVIDDGGVRCVEELPVRLYVESVG